MADPSTNPSASLSSVRVQVIQQLAGDVNIVKNKTGKQLFDTLRAVYLPISTLELSRATVSGPIQVTGNLTKVTVTPGQHSSYRLPIDLTYVRYSINELDNMTVPGGGFASVAAFLTYVRGLSLQILDEDIDLVKSVRRSDGTVSIYPSKVSWLFSPDGSYDSSTVPRIETVLPNLVTTDFDHTPQLHLALVNGNLTGFDPEGGS
jgi:hypothetical protein